MPSTRRRTETVTKREPSPPHKYLKRTRISSISDREHFKKRRRLSEDERPPQLKIPVRNKVLQKGSSPNVVLQPVLSRNTEGKQTFDSDPSTPASNEYNHFQKIEQQARAFIRGGGQHLQSQDEKRSLRSHDGGSRSYRSELASYFNNFEQMISLEPPNPDALTPKTRIVLVDDVPNFVPPRARLAQTTTMNADPFGAHKPLNNAKILDFSNVAAGSRRSKKDPLHSDIFLHAHKRPERHEKQMRNIEKERAQHEKFQLDRLLEELKGPDWLRVMGISGITESEKKLYEPKRALFVREITAMIDKFKQWKEEEKRRKIERELALVAEEEELKEGSVEEDEEEEEEEDEDDDDADEEDVAIGVEEVEEDEIDEQSVSDSPGADPPSINDLDVLAARQLLQEAKSATSRGKKTLGMLSPRPSEPIPYRPFTSFYNKKHLRDAAVAGHRRSRTLTAFGEPVPEMEEIDFELPDNILNEETIKACGRRKRRERRTSPA